MKRHKDKMQYNVNKSFIYRFHTYLQDLDHRMSSLRGRSVFTLGNFQSRLSIRSTGGVCHNKTNIIRLQICRKIYIIYYCYLPIFLSILHRINAHFTLPPRPVLLSTFLLRFVRIEVSQRNVQSCRDK